MDENALYRITGFQNWERHPRSLTSTLRDWAPPSVPQSFFSYNWQRLFIPSPASLSLRDTSSISIRRKSLTFEKLQYHYCLEYWKKTGRVRRWQHFSHEKTHFSGHPNLSHKRGQQGAGGSHSGLGGSGLNIVPRIVPLLCDESGRFVNSLSGWFFAMKWG